MKLKKQNNEDEHYVFTIIMIIVLVLICIVFCLFLYSIFNPVKENNDFNLTNGEIRFDNLSSNLEIWKTNNSSLNIVCSSYDKSFGISIEGYVWVYSQCAMIQANPNLYDKSLKDYNICFHLLNNQSVGAC